MGWSGPWRRTCSSRHNGSTSRKALTALVFDIAKVFLNLQSRRQMFTPPFPFQHRNSEEDFIAYNEAIDRDEVRDLFRRWHEEDEEAARAKAEKERIEAREFARDSALKKLLEQTAEIGKLAKKGEQPGDNFASRIWFDKSQAARYLAIGESTVDRHRQQGRLRGRPIEGTSSFRFHRDDLDNLVG